MRFSNGGHMPIQYTKNQPCISPPPPPPAHPCSICPASTGTARVTVTGYASWVNGAWLLDKFTPIAGDCRWDIDIGDPTPTCPSTLAPFGLLVFMTATTRKLASAFIFCGSDIFAFEATVPYSAGQCANPLVITAADCSTFFPASLAATFSATVDWV